jgi:hypothetical protein
MSALLVRGRNKGNFDLLPSPRAEFDREAVEVGERFYARFMENYTEQIRRHDEEFPQHRAAESTQPA